MAMENVKDAEYRKALVERFLDCDTTVEEERVLARFYHQCRRHGTVPSDEREVCEIVLATVPVGRGDTFGRLRMARRRKMAAILAAAVVVAACAMTFVLGLTHKGGEVAIAAADTDSVQNVCHGVVSADVRMPKVASSSDYALKPNRQKAATAMARTSSETCRPVSRQYASDHENAAMDVKAVYDIAVTTLHDASFIRVERKGDAALVSAVWSDGSNRRFVADLSDDGGSLSLMEI